MIKKRILLIWWEVDHRPEFLQPFIDMSDEIEFIQLIYKNKEERTTNSSPFKMIYWHDYANARAVLKDIKPALVIGVTESIFSAALINSAKKAGIPFYGLQHGYTPENISGITVDIRKFNLGLVSSYIKSTSFFLRSFSVFNIKKFCSAVYFYWLYPRMHVYKILSDHHFPWLIPGYYICFSAYAAEHYKEMYGLTNEQIKYIGIPWFDTLFQKFAQSSTQRQVRRDKYYLMIDTSFDTYHKPISQEQINRCYKTLSDFCEAQQAKLVIKLHPFNYNNLQLLQHPNIEFVRNLDDDALHTLISGCEGCFSFYSTLTLPILVIKPVIQIGYDGIYLKLPKEKGLTPLIDFYSFTKEDIHFPASEIADLHKNDIDYLIYKSDGHATERLKNILLSA